MKQVNYLCYETNVKERAQFDRYPAEKKKQIRLQACSASNR